MSKKDSLYSSHIFMFPFRFDWVEKTDIKEKKPLQEFDFYASKDIEDRIPFKTLHELLEKNNWEYEEFKMKGAQKNLLYSEYAYFYDYIRDTIYNLNAFNEHSISYFYRKKKYNNKTFEINIKEKGEGEYKIESSTYKLTIKGITLRIFQTGVGILSIELENRKYSDFKDILRINDYGRRVYPPFLDKNSGIEGTKKAFLANSIKIDPDIYEDFENQEYKDARIGSHIIKILGENIFSQDKDIKFKNTQHGMFYIQPSLDDRMFVLCWYGDDNYVEKLKNSYSEKDEWYKYIFIDNDSTTIQNEQMKEKLLAQATYDRWSNYGTIYGITRYSWTCLSPSLPTLKQKRADMIADHMNTMYFQMTILLLANRTSILRFSDEIAAVATAKNSNRLESLYSRYLTFYNRLYFKEVTHQDQGIELYDIARKQMKIDEHIEKLDNKFTKLFEFADLQAEKQRNQSLDLLTKMGAVFLPPSLLVAIYSMGIFDYMKSMESLDKGLFSILLSGLLGYLGVSLLSIKKKFFSKQNILISTIFAVVFGAIIYISLQKIGEQTKPQNTKTINKMIDKPQKGATSVKQ
jgi:Mg2+ and Co2+ transporter CorA